MSDSAVADPDVSTSVDQEFTDSKAEILFEHKLPGVWGRVYPKTSKEGKPALTVRMRTYKKTKDDKYEDSDFINSMTDCDNIIEVAYELKKFMRKFYAERDQ